MEKNNLSNEKAEINTNLNDYVDLGDFNEKNKEVIPSNQTSNQEVKSILIPEGVY